MKVGRLNICAFIRSSTTVTW